jgi:ribosome assembly protein RRB1
MPPKKRDREAGSQQSSGRSGPGGKDEDAEMEQPELEFEDPFGDEFEEEEMIEDDVDDDGSDAEDDDAMIIDEEGDDDEDGKADGKGSGKQVWRPGVDTMEEGEELEYDPSAYVMYHSLKMEWPCLSFDVVRDNLGEGRHRVR